MQYQLGTHGIGGRDESWFSLVVDDDTGELFHEHTWHNLSFSGAVNEGTRRLPLAQAQGKPYFREAEEKARELGLLKQ